MGLTSTPTLDPRLTTIPNCFPHRPPLGLQRAAGNEKRLGNYRELVVWQKAHQFTIDIYYASACFPREEIFGITSQLRRAAVSVELNIAEGSGRGSDAEFARFLRMARGSLREIDNLLLLACDLGFLEHPLGQGLQRRADEIGRMLTGLAAGISCGSHGSGSRESGSRGS
jgi:four helix bundle protein